MPDEINISLPENPRELARALKKLRKLAEVSGLQMAEHCGVNPNSVYHWEHAGVIKATDLVRYMDRLGFKITIQCPPPS